MREIITVIMYIDYKGGEGGRKGGRNKKEEKWDVIGK